MKCEVCRARTATTKVKTIVEGKLTERALCAGCARRLGYSTLFTGLDRGFGSMMSDYMREGGAEDSERCPQCGASFEEIVRSGKVGCAHCYETFAERLLPLVQRLYGSGEHCGKMPGQNLPQAVEQESAAMIGQALRQALAQEADAQRALEGSGTDA